MPGTRGDPGLELRFPRQRGYRVFRNWLRFGGGGWFDLPTMNNVKIVQIVMPPTSTRPIEFRAAALAPLTSVSGK